MLLPAFHRHELLRHLKAVRHGVGCRLKFNLQPAGEQGVEMPMVVAWKKMFNISLSLVMIAKAVLPPLLQPLVMRLAAALGEKSLLSHEVLVSRTHCR